jgi:predicted DNA-binding transcriptional regulator YafY
VDGEGVKTERTVVPLGLYFWGKQWLLAAYCLMRQDYRSFRVDRVVALTDAAPDAACFPFGVEPPTLPGYVRAMEEQRTRELAAGSCSAEKSPA